MNLLTDKIKELRDVSGAGFLDCKKALEENNNDIENSVTYLRKKGLIKATKKSSREANEGSVGIFSDENRSLLIEINTETDFAAKNEIFLNFVEEISNFAISLNEDLSKDEFMNKKYKDKLISDIFSEQIAKIGENIILKRMKFIKKEKNTKIYSYTHNAYKKNIGKICVALKVQVNNDNEKLNQIGKNLCMHIAATKPLSLDIESLDKKIIEKEKEIQLESIKSSGKPENIIEKILDGKMKKFYSEVTFLNQNFIMDPEKTVKKVIEEASSISDFKIIDYSIFVLGN